MTQSPSFPRWCLLLPALGTLSGCSPTRADVITTRSRDAGGASADAGPGAFGASDPSAFVSDLPPGIEAASLSGDNTVERFFGGVTDGPIRIAETAPASVSERADADADIAQIAGDRLYALSHIAGLSITDISDPTQPRLLGSYRDLPGTPLHLYLRGSVAIAVLTGWERAEVRADGGRDWVQMGEVIALDVADPASIRPLGSFDSPGVIKDSYLKGDVLYLLGFRDGACFGCEPGRTEVTVASLDLRDPRALQRVDELAYPTRAGPASAPGLRPVLFTQQRIYLGDPVRNEDEGASTTMLGFGRLSSAATIQVVDISAADGQLVNGAQVTIPGLLTARSRMDEYQGVLRVVTEATEQSLLTSQTAGLPPSVQTFAVESSQQLRVLGRADLGNLEIDVVRFDGPRAYVLASGELWTLDLSQPAQPRRAAVLAVPRMFQLEPRGDRLLGLHYLPDGGEGPIAVSLLDVSNLGAPKALTYVSSDAGWSTRFTPEGQWAFEALADSGLALVPFIGASPVLASHCLRGQRSGIQLVSLDGDALTLRGTLPSEGEPHHLIAHADRFWSIGHETVDSFDVADPTRPTRLGSVRLAPIVSQILPLANGFAARIRQDWYVDSSSIDFVKQTEAENAAGVGELNLARTLESRAMDCSQYDVITAAFSVGNRIDLVFTSSDGREGLLVIDATDPRQPKVLSRLDSGLSRWNGTYRRYSYGYSPALASSAHTGSALVRFEQRLNGGGGDTWLRVIDLRDPGAPSQTLLEAPPATGYGDLLVSGDAIAFTHVERGADGRRGSFYLDRIDLSDPRNPKLAAPVNTPGPVLHYSAEHRRALTSELVRVLIGGITAEQCAERFAQYEFPYVEGSFGLQKGACAGYLQVLHLVRLEGDRALVEDSLALGERERISSASSAGGAFLAVLARDHLGLASVRTIDCSLSQCGQKVRAASLLVLTGLDGDKLRATRFTGGETPWPGFFMSPAVYALGDAALLIDQREAAIIDTRHPEAPALLRTVPLLGEAIEVSRQGAGALLALGARGVQRIDLSSQP